MASTEIKAFDIHPVTKPLSVPKLPVEKKEAPKATEKPAAKTESKADDSESTSIPVTINQSKGLITEEPKEESSDEKPAEPAPAAPSETTVHHEKKIEPLADKAEEPAEKPAEPVEAKAEAAEVKVEEPEKPAPAETVEEPKGAPAYTREETEAEVPKPAEKPAEPAQEPKVFDTTQYHLPIKTSKSHNSGKHMTGFVVVFLLLILVAAVIAIDAGWLDVGVKLPFDFIQN